MVCETSVRLLRRPTFWGHRTRCLFGQKPRKPLLPQSEQGAAWRPEKSTWKGRTAELPMPHRTSDGQGILRHSLHPLLEPASKLLNMFMASIGFYVKLQFVCKWDASERMSPCRKNPRSASHIICNDINNYSNLQIYSPPPRTIWFIVRCANDFVQKRKKDMKFSVLIRQHILHEIGLH